MSGISGLTIYLINNNTGDRYQVPIFFFSLRFSKLNVHYTCTKTVQMIYPNITKSSSYYHVIQKYIKPYRNAGTFQAYVSNPKSKLVKYQNRINVINFRLVNPNTIISKPLSW